MGADAIEKNEESIIYCHHAAPTPSNHFHLLLSSDLPNGPSLLMKFLGQRYVQYVNRVYKRSGSLWEGRFRSSLVQTQHYVLGCYRYIEMNPVRASMMKSGEGLTVNVER